MAVADRILAETPTGSVTAVIGRPGAGVSTLLGQVCMTATASAPVVLASWERPPTFSTALAGVVQPKIIGWSAEELGQCAEVRDTAPGTVVAVDYLQLLGDSGDGAGRSLCALAANRSWRLLLGVMAPRRLRDLGSALPPALVVHRAGRVLAGALQQVDRAVVITGGDVGVRSACFALPTEPRGTWRLRWATHVDEAPSS